MVPRNSTSIINPAFSAAFLVSVTGGLVCVMLGRYSGAGYQAVHRVSADFIFAFVSASKDGGGHEGIFFSDGRRREGAVSIGPSNTKRCLLLKHLERQVGLTRLTRVL